MSKKIAICLSGKFTDSINRIYEQQVRHLIGFLAGTEYDLYIHSWKQSSELESYVIENLKPKKYLFEDGISFRALASRIKSTESNTLKPSRNEGSISMFYSMEKAFSLIKDTEQYDYIIRLRPDIYSVFSLRDILASVVISKEIGPNVVYIPNNFLSKGMNDQFAIATPKTMKQYFSVYSYIQENIESLFFNPENIIARYLIEKNIRISFLDMPYALHRSEEMKPWITAHLLHQQEQIWWSRTFNLPRLQDVTFFIKQRFMSAEFLERLSKNVKFIGIIKGENKLVLIETNDYDPNITIRALTKVFGIFFPSRVKNIHSITDYSNKCLHCYFYINIDSHNILTLSQTITDGNSMVSKDISFDKYLEVSKLDYNIVFVKFLFLLKDAMVNIIVKIKKHILKDGRSATINYIKQVIKKLR